MISFAEILLGVIILQNTQLVRLKTAINRLTETIQKYLQ